MPPISSLRLLELYLLLFDSSTVMGSSFSSVSTGNCSAVTTSQAAVSDSGSVTSMAKLCFLAAQAELQAPLLRKRLSSCLWQRSWWDPRSDTTTSFVNRLHASRFSRKRVQQKDDRMRGYKAARQKKKSTQTNPSQSVSGSDPNCRLTNKKGCKRPLVQNSV